MRYATLTSRANAVLHILENLFALRRARKAHRRARLAIAVDVRELHHADLLVAVVIEQQRPAAIEATQVDRLRRVVEDLGAEPALVRLLARKRELSGALLDVDRLAFHLERAPNDRAGLRHLRRSSAARDRVSELSLGERKIVVRLHAA
jgi:hypothetical protein